MNKYKTSYGIALCRYNKKQNNCIEILSIKKRFTYYYFSFIHGYYKNIANNKYISYLFDNMSFYEKLMILNMNFSYMWWLIWLYNPEKGISIFDQTKKDSDMQDNTNIKYYAKYFKQKNKFEKLFLLDGGKKLGDLVNNSKNSDPIWEIPKGAADNNETNLDTAIREFTEETQIPFYNYDILYHVKPVILTYKDNGIYYKHIYYLAELNENGYLSKQTMYPKINFRNHKQLSEVSDIEWINLNYINYLKLSKKNKKNMIQLYSNIIRKFKKNNSKINMKY